MFYQAKNGRIRMKDNHMDYVVFGKGSRNLILIPGVGDGLKTMRGMALPFAFLYRRYAKDYRVYVFSRKAKLPRGTTIRDMARDQARAMKCLGIEKADVIGVSQGGMIVQHLALDYPRLVDRMVLAVTLPKTGGILLRQVRQWIRCLDREEYQDLVRLMIGQMYSPRYCKKMAWLYPLMAVMLKRMSKERFRIMCQAASTHDLTGKLDGIRAKTLVIAAGKDRVVGTAGGKRLAEEIPGARLLVFENGEHGVYDEDREFHLKILEFLKR